MLGFIGNKYNTLYLEHPNLLSLLDQLLFFVHQYHYRSDHPNQLGGEIINNIENYCLHFFAAP